jgi:hypothetical protein
MILFQDKYSKSHNGETLFVMPSPFPCPLMYRKETDGILKSSDQEIISQKALRDDIASGRGFTPLPFVREGVGG